MGTVLYTLSATFYPSPKVPRMRGLPCNIFNLSNNGRFYNGASYTSPYEMPCPMAEGNQACFLLLPAMQTGPARSGRPYQSAPKALLLPHGFRPFVVTVAVGFVGHE